MKPDAADLDRALRRIHTPESFGRAVLAAALSAVKDSDTGEMAARVAVSAPEPDGTVPVCFFLFDYEICISLPVT